MDSGRLGVRLAQGTSSRCRSPYFISDILVDINHAGSTVSLSEATDLQATLLVDGHRVTLKSNGVHLLERAACTEFPAWISVVCGNKYVCVNPVKTCDAIVNMVDTKGAEHDVSPYLHHMWVLTDDFTTDRLKTFMSNDKTVSFKKWGTKEVSYCDPTPILDAIRLVI